MTAAVSAIDLTTAVCAAVASGAGEVIRIFDEEAVVKLASSDTAEDYALVELGVAPSGGPPLHAHPVAETLYVLDGQFEFTHRARGELASARGGPGAVFHAPPGALHRFENVGRARGSLLVLCPSDLVDLLRDLGRAFPPGAEPDMETMLEVNARHSTTVVYGGDGSRPEPIKGGATSARARELAWRFRRLNEELIATVERCSLDEWRAICADTGWTVAVQAHHVAAGEAAIASLLRSIAVGQAPPPLNAATVDAINARHAEQFAAVTQAETVVLLRANGEAAAGIYRDMTDAELAETAVAFAGLPPVSVASLIEQLAIGEIERHGAHLRSACAARSQGGTMRSG